MKLHEVISQEIPWKELRHKKAVMPYLLDSPELRAMGERPNPAEPNIFTSANLKQYPRQDAKTLAAGGDKVTPLPSMSDDAWVDYMNKAWPELKQNAAKGDPNAKGKIEQIKKELGKKINLNKLNVNQKFSFTIDQTSSIIKEFVFQVSNTEKIYLTENVQHVKHFMAA